MTYKRNNTRTTPRHNAVYSWLTRHINSVCQATYRAPGSDKPCGFVTSVEWQGEKPYPEGHC